MLCRYVARVSQIGGCGPLDDALAVCESSAGYAPRNPAESVLYNVVAGDLENFLAGQRRRDRVVPRFVERELRKFLECGVLANGFLRVHCDACGQDRVVAFSCKGRGICSSCGGRRMAETAAHLVDRVLPEVPIRQWVLSFPVALRYRLAYDSRLVSDVLGIFIRAVFASLRRQARAYAGIRKAQCGVVTFVQRFGGAVNLNVHFDSLVLDGVYYLDDRQRLDSGDCLLPAMPRWAGSRLASPATSRGYSNGGDWGERRIRTKRTRCGAISRCSPNSMPPPRRGVLPLARVREVF